VFLGPPGSGKGTQGAALRQRFSICHLATGDILRAAVAAGTAMGLKAKPIMDRGELVPDDVMIGVIAEALDKPECHHGFVLDGFPRTLPQAEQLDSVLAVRKQCLNSVVEFKIDDSVLLDRIAGRLVHAASGRTYHVRTHPPKVAGKDDVTGEPLEKRKDDTEEVLKRRLDAYHKSTKPLLGYYAAKGVLTSMDATRSSADCTQVILGAISAAQARLKK